MGRMGGGGVGTKLGGGGNSEGILVRSAISIGFFLVRIGRFLVRFLVGGFWVRFWGGVVNFCCPLVFFW